MHAADPLAVQGEHVLARFAPDAQLLPIKQRHHAVRIRSADADEPTCARLAPDHRAAADGERLRDAQANRPDERRHADGQHDDVLHLNGIRAREGNQIRVQERPAEGGFGAVHQIIFGKAQQNQENDANIRKMANVDFLAAHAQPQRPRDRRKPQRVIAEEHRHACADGVRQPAEITCQPSGRFHNRRVHDGCHQHGEQRVPRADSRTKRQAAQPVHPLAGAHQHEDEHAQHQNAVLHIAPNRGKIAADDAVIHRRAEQHANHAGEQRQPHHLENRDIHEGVKLPEEHCQRQRKKRSAPEEGVDVRRGQRANIQPNTGKAHRRHQQQDAEQAQVHPRHLPSADGFLRVFHLACQRSEGFSPCVTAEGGCHHIPKADFQFVLHLGFFPLSH